MNGVESGTDSLFGSLKSVSVPDSTEFRSKEYDTNSMNQYANIMYRTSLE